LIFRSKATPPFPITAHPGRQTLYCLPDHRAQGSDQQEISGTLCQPRLRLLHLPGCLPLEQESRRKSGNGFFARAGNAFHDPERLVYAEHKKFNRLFQHSALKRAKFEGLKRNLEFLAGKF